MSALQGLTARNWLRMIVVAGCYGLLGPSIAVASGAKPPADVDQDTLPNSSDPISRAKAADKAMADAREEADKHVSAHAPSLEKIAEAQAKQDEAGMKLLDSLESKPKGEKDGAQASDKSGSSPDRSPDSTNGTAAPEACPINREKTEVSAPSPSESPSNAAKESVPGEKVGGGDRGGNRERGAGAADKGDRRSGSDRASRGGDFM